jgi:hypothetical protein
MTGTYISTGYPAWSPQRTFSYYATEQAKSDEQIRELAYQFELHRKPITSLIEGVCSLRTWGTEWPDYDADPPTSATVDRALEWAKQLYLDVHDSGRTWIEPLITASEAGEAMFEWQIRRRRLTIEVTESGVVYSKLSGSPGNFQSEDGVPDTKQKRQALWAWLTS